MNTSDQIAPLEISVVSPVYGAEGIVEALVKQLREQLLGMAVSFEIILVEDASPDNSWEEMKREAQRHKEVKAFKLSRNFGQHQTITAGLDKAKGRWVVVMDCDLQDKPSEIPRLYAKAQEGFKVVLAKRSFRRDTFIKRQLSKWFYRVMTMLTGMEQDHTVANFGIYHQDVITAVTSMRESVRFFPLQVKWVGFPTSSITVDHGEREVGETSYTFSRALNLAIDVMLSFSDKPLRLTIRGGMIILVVGFVLAMWLMVRTLLLGFTGEGWLSLMASIWFLTGILLIVLGMVGLYIGKIFAEVKNRPIYIIAEEVGTESQ